MDSNWTKVGVATSVVSMFVAAWVAFRPEPPPIPPPTPPVPPQAALDVFGVMYTIPREPQLAFELAEIPQRHAAQEEAISLLLDAYLDVRFRGSDKPTKAESEKDEALRKTYEESVTKREAPWIGSLAYWYSKGQPIRLAEISIHNVGSVTVRDFHVVLPEKAYSVVVQRGPETKFLKDQQDVLLGEIQPSETLVLSTWDEHPFMDEEEVTYRHAEGAGKATIRSVDQKLSRANAHIATLEKKIAEAIEVAEAEEERNFRWWFLKLATVVGLLTLAVTAGMVANVVSAIIRHGGLSAMLAADPTHDPKGPDPEPPSDAPAGADESEGSEGPNQASVAARGADGTVPASNPRG